MNSDVRIAHLIETGNPGGAEMFVFRLCQQQIAEGLFAKVYLIKDGWLANLLRDNGIPVTVLAEPRWNRPQTLWAFCQQARRDKLTVLHSHEFLMNCVSAVVALFLGIRHVATVHGGHYYSSNAVRRLAYRFVARVSGLVAVSNQTAEALRTELPVSAKRVQVIANGINTKAQKPTADTVAAWRRDRNIPSDVRLIGSVGALRQEKGHDDLIRAFSLLRRQRDKVHLVIAGKGRQADMLHDLVRQLGVEDCVHFLGHVDEVPVFLAALDIFVMASHFEGMPLALLEAMSAGVPVIATRVGGVPEVLNSPAVGHLVPPHNPSELAKAMQEDLENHSRASDRGLAGQQRVKQTFDQSIVLAAYMGRYTGRLQAPNMVSAA